MDLQDVVNANQHRFSETEREILAFMLENEEFVAESTINSLAHKTYTSTSSIIRLTKKLNFSGFAELKYFIKSSLNRSEPFNPRFIESGREDIQRTYDYLEHMELSGLLKRIHEARTVYCFGTGYAQRNAVQEFTKSMQVCGKFCQVIPARNEFESAMNNMTQDDVVIIVSFSGQTENMREHIKMLALRRHPHDCGDRHWCELHVFTRRVLPALPDDPHPRSAPSASPTTPSLRCRYCWTTSCAATLNSLRMSAASPCRTRWMTSSTAGAKSTPDKALLCPPAPSLTPPESDRIHLRSPERGHPVTAIFALIENTEKMRKYLFWYLMIIPALLLLWIALGAANSQMDFQAALKIPFFTAGIPERMPQPAVGRHPQIRGRRERTHRTSLRPVPDHSAGHHR